MILRLPETRNLNPADLSHYFKLLTWILFCPSLLAHYLRQDSSKEKVRFDVSDTILSEPLRNTVLMSVILVITIPTLLTVISSIIDEQVLSIWQFAWPSLSGLILASAIFRISVKEGKDAAWALSLSVVAGLGAGLAFGRFTPEVVALFTSIALATVGDTMAGAIFGILFGVAMTAWQFPAGAIDLFMARVPLFYICESLYAWRVARSLSGPIEKIQKHPLVLDEAAAGPLPGARRLLVECLESDLNWGLNLAVRLMMNPLQRGTVRRAMLDFLEAHPYPLSVIYQLLALPLPQGNWLSPLFDPGFTQWNRTKLDLLGEIGQVRLIRLGRIQRIWQWIRSRFFGQTQTTKPLNRFVGLLYQLVHEEHLREASADELRHLLSSIWRSTDIRDIQQGSEIVSTYFTFSMFLGCHSITDVARAESKLNWIGQIEGQRLRPVTIRALGALGDVSRSVGAYTRSTSTGHKSIALNRAAADLDELMRFVTTQVDLPDVIFLAQIIRVWQSIVAVEQGILGEKALQSITPRARREAGFDRRESDIWLRPAKPIGNPYVVGNPVYPPLFVGRNDIFNRIAEVWSAKERPDSVILYGHRRMGKSSILRNLNQVAPVGSVIVFIDLAGETSFVDSASDLLLGIADKIFASVSRAFPEAKIERPDIIGYSSPAQAQIQFNRLTDQIRNAVSGTTIVLALDEFEAVDVAVHDHKISKEIYQFLRTKTQDPLFTFVFGGLHTLDEMSRDYQQPFYGSYENIKVSYLTHDEAWRLITGPTFDFTLNYEPEAVEHIIAETGGQPYLVQQVCRDALDRLNYELFDENKTRDVIITLADIDKVLGPDLFVRGTVYFDGVWSQTTNADQQTLLSVIAQRDEVWSYDELVSATRLLPEVVRDALRWAERHDILHSTDGETWQFYVPLMRRWVREMK